MAVLFTLSIRDHTLGTKPGKTANPCCLPVQMSSPAVRKKQHETFWLDRFRPDRPTRTPIWNAFKIGVSRAIYTHNKRLKLIGAWYLYLLLGTVLP